MSDSRSRILASVRNALASARHLPAPPLVTQPPPAPHPPAPAALIRQFADELKALSGVLIEEQSERVPARVLQLLRERGADSVLAWDPAHLPIPGLLDDLRGAGIKIVDAVIPNIEPARSQRLAEVERAAIGLTGVDAALADTGTLALRTGPGRPRLASLSVRTHIALLTPGQLHASWAAWWAAQENAEAWVGAASSLTLISGPSRTADIEMTLTVGVHGPGEVVALLITE
jgi:L-lactate dehydrogenase complex protein LldG